MQFFSAISGWQWLLVAGVPAGILALYFLKLKRKPLEVPSTFLWKRSIEDLQVNSLWQRLRRSLLLFLQLLVAAALIFALLRPMLDRTTSGKRIILAIDQSASMSATDISPTRLAEAKRRALDVVEQLQPGDVAMVISFANRARIACSYTSDSSVLRQAIDSIAPTAATTDFREALTIASGLANAEQTPGDDVEANPAILYLFSDGDFPPVDDLPLGNIALRYIATGKSSSNVAIVSIGARRSADSSDRWQIFARMRNFADAPATFNAEFFVDDTRRDIQSVSIPAKESSSIVFRLAAVDAAVIGVSLDLKDDLALDNRAWTIIHQPRKVRLLVIGPENPILRSALGTEAVAEVADVEFAKSELATKNLATELQPGSYDLVVFDRCSPASMPETNTLFLGALPPALATSVQTPAKNPAILNWMTTNPILRYLTLDDVAVLEAFSIPLPKNARGLIETDQGVILFAVPRQGHTDVVQTFPLIGDDGHWKTDWPLKLSFPLYVMNLIRHLAGAESTEQTSYLAGAPVTFPGTGGPDQAMITFPSGREEKVQRSRRGNFEFHNTDELGVYGLAIGDEKSAFAVNLLSDRESAIAPNLEVAIGTVQAKDESAEVASRRELWKLLTLVALVLLLFEWYVYHRRGYL